MREQLTTAINKQFKTATTNYTEQNDRVLDTVVDTNRKLVDFAVKTVDRVADSVASQAPALKIDLPFSDRLPTPAEAGERYLDVVERIVEMNRDFNERVIEMLPVDVKKAAPKAAPKVVVRKPAKKATARKVTKKVAKKVPATAASATK